MAIVGQNSLLNQYVPTFYIKDLRDGQTLRYDAVRKAFINAEGNGAGGVDRLGELLDVADSVDNPLSLQDGQALVYDTFTSQWRNQFLDYNTLANKPIIPDNNSFSFVGLSDTATPAIPDGYVKWNSTGTELIYSTTIPANSITGLATVALTGDYNDLSNLPAPQIITLTGDVTGSGTGTFATTLATVNLTTGTFGNGTTVPQITVDSKGRITNVINVPISESGIGTVTSVTGSGTDGVTFLVVDSTTTPNITIGLGDITPDSVSSVGTITGSNLSGTNTGDETETSILDKLGITSISGTNTGDQTIELTGDVTGSGTGAFATSLSDTGVTPGTYNLATVTVDSKGRVTSISSGSEAGTGTVTSITVLGNDGITTTGSPITTSGTIDLYLGDITPDSINSAGTIAGSNLSGTNTGDQTIELTGDVTGSGTGTFTATLATVNTTPGIFGDSHYVPTVTVNAKGLVTAVTTQHVDTTVRDLVELDDTIVIAARHQYIVTGTLEVEGRIENNGRIAIL